MEKHDYLGLSPLGFHKIAYTEWGQANEKNKTVICVHGLTRNSRDFDRLASFLSDRDYHVYCPDIVGRGDSDWLKNPALYTYEQYLSDMNALIARANTNEVDWIGTSMGGLIGLFLATLPKTPIKRLILNDIGPQIPVKGLKRLAEYVGFDPEFKSIESAQNYYKTIYSSFGKLSDEEWRYFTENSIKEIGPGRFISKIDPNIKLVPSKGKLLLKLLTHPYKTFEGTLFDVNLWYIWQQLTCPVLIIHGQKSDLLTPEIIEKMQQTHNNTEVVEVPDTGHSPALLDPKQHEIIYNWLKRTE